ncbi:hypothetical protein E1295_24175 [Nonomuraea mesophila]|uniref:Uncharacterized protein n=1 Tax=Nonomuraea mesophila TaxID=2530382 RepID=A0A4R5FAE6_9ACTN|nr:hypothetical protein [Nonomuraea mesophila]TDE45742.1 hypothetical protein E1295_24175 [Nonomuraea mesophila]
MSEITRDDAIEALRFVIDIDALTESQIILANPIFISRDESISRLELAEVDAAVAALNDARQESNSRLQWESGFECLLVRNSDRPSPVRNLGEVSSQDENGIIYSIGGPSLAFMINLLHVLRIENKRPSIRLMNVRRRLRDRAYYAPGRAREELEVPVTFESVLADMGIVTTLRIRAAKSRSDFKEIGEAFLFEVAYNYDDSYLIASDLDPILGLRTMRRRGRSPEAMDAPRMIYSSDLVHHYQLALSADSPMLKFISYYHILEHFFEKVFNDDRVDQVRRKIADPSFSLRRSKDVQGVINVILASQKQVRDEGGVDEQRSCFLVLDRYVQIQRLVADLNAFDQNLIAYYKLNSPSFSDNTPVDLSDKQHEKVKKALAKRIYQTRNALVHAKDGAKPKYFPFVNDSELTQEIPLLRFCAEQVVIAHGKII